jgi:hypothetical protein
VKHSMTGFAREAHELAMEDRDEEEAIDSFC